MWPEREGVVMTKRIILVLLLATCGAAAAFGQACTPDGTQTCTTFNNLSKPNAGTTNWAAKINANWDALDAIIGHAHADSSGNNWVVPGTMSAASETLNRQLPSWNLVTYWGNSLTAGCEDGTAGICSWPSQFGLLTGSVPNN